MRTIAAACAVAVALSGCGESATAPDDVIGTVWQLDFLTERGGPPVLAPSGGRFTLRFAENGRLEVRADCNTCSGAYQLFGRALTVGPLACTRAFCPTAPLDSQFVAFIEAATTADRRRGDTLVLSSQAVEVHFTQ